MIYRHRHTHRGGETAFISDQRALTFVSQAQLSYQVSIQPVKAVSGVGVVTRPIVLRADELHDLVLSFARSLQINTHTHRLVPLLPIPEWISAVNTPHGRRDKP